MKKKNKITEKEIIDKLRKPIPPPTRPHKDETRYDRRRDRKNWYNKDVDDDDD